MKDNAEKSEIAAVEEKLAKFGYEIDFISGTEVIFRKVPQLLSKISPKEILADILENMHGDLDNIEEISTQDSQFFEELSVALQLSDEEIQKRMDAWVMPEPKIKEGWLSRYARLVTSADEGAILK